MAAIKKRSLVDQVYERLRNDIITLRLPLGSKVNVNELQDTLGVSCTPIREAVNRLQQEGLVTYENNVGARVLTLAPKDVEEIQQLATQVAEDNYALSTKQLEEHNPDENRLVELIPHLLNEYKFYIVESRLKELLLELRSPEALQSPERARAIMEEHARFNQLKKVLSPMIGTRIITR
jgi:DNA-binding GntR family transcriptional regulator